MANPKQQNRPALGVHLLESRDCPAVFNIANGDVAALNAAIVASNANSVDDTINLAAGGRYTLTAEAGVESGDGLAIITADNRSSGGPAKITINGKGATIERQSGAETAFRLMEVEAGAFLFINDVTMQNGKTGEDQSGGAILVGGGVDIRNSLFVNNSAADGGGAIAFDDESNTSFLWNSTFTGNSNTNTDDSGGGGAIFVSDVSRKVTITNCTIAFNSNTANVENGELLFYGGGLRSNNNAELVNSILSDNTDSDAPNDLAFDIEGTFEARNSIIREYGQGTQDEINIAGPNNLLDTAADTNNPQLRTLANNGGQSATLSLKSNSAAINAGDNFFSPPSTFDQRGKGFARRVGGHIDIGAYEFKANTRVTLTSSANPSALGRLVTFTATVIPDASQRTGIVNPLEKSLSGTFTFTIDGHVVAKVATDAKGHAKFSISTLARGSHSVVATFAPDAESLDPGAASLIQVVGKVSRRYDR
ncbi:Ig-like domain-containing protein [Zavarzinella formosa]|uniref:Ig-like domain-containing protein n=1 Tax=Zavarzinella formosa TaxID=360055 RepID=UPI000314615B|nr:Ig-like domain-containing protein [Zavarzinella formosa]